MSNRHDIPIACDLTAIPVEVRETHMSEVKSLFAKVQEVREVPDGQAFRFGNDPGIVLELANFVEYERLCCPFFAFGIEVEAGGGPLWLRLTGGEGVKEFWQAMLSEMNHL